MLTILCIQTISSFRKHDFAAPFFKALSNAIFEVDQVDFDRLLTVVAAYHRCTKEQAVRIVTKEEVARHCRKVVGQPYHIRAALEDAYKMFKVIIVGLCHVCF